MISTIKYLLLVFLSAFLSIIIDIGLSRYFRFSQKLSDIFFVLLFLVVYFIILRLWMKIDKNWNK